MYDFTDRVVMISGGTGNLGQATAAAFASTGARVVVVDRNRDKQHGMYPEWVDSERHWLASPVDLSSPAGAAQVVEEAVERMGRIDVLVNAIGGYRAGDPTHQTPVETWDFMMELNARTVFLACRAVIPQMLAQQSGKIVNVAARAGISGSTNHSAYSASKSAVIRLTETLAAELRTKGVNANSILPGTIDTPQNREAMPDADFSRWVEPESLAAVIQFLASEQARDVHGAALPVYGQS
jgi:NAD(P)-dependent dehydrogenase (short-subunit alcohol dehydrogenase family)